MLSLGDVYVDVHANTRDLKPEIRKAADDAGDEGGKRFSKNFDKQAKRSLGRFQKDFSSSITKALDNLPEVDITADSSDAQREIFGLRSELKALSDLEIGVDIDAAGALARLGAIRVALAALSDSGDIDIGLNARGALGSISALTNLLPQFATSAGGAGGGAARLSASVGALGASAAASAPLIIAFGAAIALLVGVAGAAAGALGGLALALGAPLGAAAGGGGLFALLAGKYVGETNKVLDQIKQLKEDSKFGEANALIAKLTTAQKGYMKAREGLSAAFKSFTKDNDSALLTPFTLGLEKLTKILRGSGLEALINAVSGSLNKFLLNLDTTGINNLLLSMSKLAGPIIDSVLRSLESFGSIVGSIFGAGKDLGVKALDGMSDALGRLAGYLESAEGQKQLQEFFTWVETHGPGIWQNFLDIAGGVKDFIKAMTPAGEAFLAFLGFFGKFGFLAPVFKAAMAVIIGSFTGLLTIIAGVTATLGGLFQLIGKIPGTPDWVDGIGEGLNGISTKAWDASKEMTNLILETDKASAKKVNIPVSANTKPAKEDVDAIVAGIGKLNPFIPTNADTTQAEETTSKWAAGWGNRTINLKLGATITAAAQKVMDFVKKYGWIAGIRGQAAAGGRLPAGFAHGGKVPGTTPRNRSFDNVAAITRKGNPLRVQSGEWIINSTASRMNDRLLAAINGGFNAQRAMGFSMGGVAPVGRKMGGSSSGISSINNSDNRNININLNEYGPRSGSVKIRDLKWWMDYGTRTRFGVAPV